ncbi:MAG: sigma-70 family RNA polymerase sigma factor, partial [Planctomycetes bacterium]|nr:sigma-70 family RNA polymerase sigma factor [Planctomycetota bacterium]
MASKTPDPSEEIADGAAGLSAILAGCRAGNREFQRQLYELYHHRIHRLMVRIVGLQDAADVTQQVFMQVFRKIGQFAGQAKFETWLYRVAVNEARQHLRKRGRHPTQPLVVEPVSRHPSDDRR